MKIERKKNKGMNEQQQPDSGLHDTATLVHMFQPCRPHSS